jgi:hypothetical protein
MAAPVARSRTGPVVARLMRVVYLLALVLGAQVAYAQDDTPAAVGEADPGGGAEAPVTGSAPPASTPSPRYGQYPPPDQYAAAPITEAAQIEGIPGAREHEGVYVRLQLGPGAARSRYKESVNGVDTAKVQASGLSGTFDLTLGGRAVSSLILHGNLTYTRSHAPSRQVDGVKDASIEVTTTALALGGGATYYFMPYNLFLGAALGPSWLFETRKGAEVRSNTGVFALGSGGKEWWVGPRSQWALGAALRYTFAAARVEIGGVESMMKYMDLVLALSITFN